MIKVQDLSKTFRTEEVETIALDKVSFEVKDGEFVAIMGPPRQPHLGPVLAWRQRGVRTA